MAATQGVRVLALTDHDTVAGIAEAALAAIAHGMALIPGVELSCTVDAGEVHLLGYFIETGDAHFLAMLDRFRTTRDTRGQTMVAKLNALGIPLRWERVQAIADGAVITRPHVARALIEMGAATSIADAFARYLNRDAPAYADRERLLPPDAVRLVRSAGGVPVLAHPFSVADLDGTLAEMVAAGLMGLEAQYGGYAPERRAELAALAALHGLLTTAGSDFHGEGLGGPALGSTPPPPDVVDALMSAALRVRSDRDRDYPATASE